MQPRALAAYLPGTTPCRGTNHRLQTATVGDMKLVSLTGVGSM